MNNLCVLIYVFIMYFTTNYYLFSCIIAITCKKILKDPLSSFNILFKNAKKLYKMGSKNTNNNDF